MPQLGALVCSRAMTLTPLRTWRLLSEWPSCILEKLEVSERWLLTFIQIDTELRA